jgi:nonribosomal peptide synthetase protein BlmVIII
VIAVAPPDPRVYEVLAEAGLGRDLFNPRQHRSCELVDRYALAHAAALLHALEVDGLLAAPQTADALVAARGFAGAFRRPLTWLLRYLAHAGVLAAEGAGWRLAGTPPGALAEIRAAVLDTDPSYAPALALLDEAAAIYPRVARGETSGERALFLRARLWADYFDNANGYYGLTNRVAARAAAARLPARGRVLEVGAGLGSATSALLAEVGDLTRLGAYDVTEPVPFFRRRAERTLATAHAGAPLAFGAIDLNQPWGTQGADAGGHDLVFGVNVMHLARDLDAALGEAHAALAPGGFLVLGEGLRPGPDVPVAAELPFQLLESFADVETNPATRPCAGFLTAETWLAALARAGFVDVGLVPDAIRLRALVPAFLAAAVVGRRAA